MTALTKHVDGQALARVNWGRWIADCTRCDSAVAFEDITNSFTCPECGMRWEVLWPPEQLMADISRLLLMRPHPKHRNWSTGETLIDLMTENGAHGVFDPLNQHPEIGGPGVTLMSLTETVIQIDELPSNKSQALQAYQDIKEIEP
jgi:hypothetical protein